MSRLAALVLGALLFSGCAGDVTVHEPASPAESPVPGTSLRASETCPEQGPWTDRDCPEAQWMLDVIRHAGFLVEDDTGSAFRIQRDVSECVDEDAESLASVCYGSAPVYIWATDRVSTNDLGAEGYKPWFRVGSTQVFSADSWVTWWSGQRTVWISPFLRESKPLQDDITELVEASQSEPLVSAAEPE